MNEKQAVGREAARIRLEDEARREWSAHVDHVLAMAAKLGIKPELPKEHDPRDAFMDGYAAGDFAAAPERFVVPDLGVLEESLTPANAAAQALAHFDSLMFTAGGDQRLAIEAALSRAMDIGAALVAQGLAGTTTEVKG